MHQGYGSPLPHHCTLWHMRDTIGAATGKVVVVVVTVTMTMTTDRCHVTSDVLTYIMCGHQEPQNLCTINI